MSKINFIHSFAICSGARNLKIVESLLNFGITFTHHFDEREASFFALGVARKEQKATAVICTSGTAVSECYSAVIESYYSGIPLVIISADRPKRYRGTGSPQSIEQNNIFGLYAETIDIEITDQFHPENLSDFKINPSGPTHINICVEDKVFNQDISKKIFCEDSDNNLEKIDKFFSKSKNPLIIIGPLNHTYRRKLTDYLNNINCYYLIESTSGLRELRSLTNKSLLGYEKTASILKANKLIDGIIRFGNVPTVRLFRELEEFSIPVLSVNNLNFRGSPTSAIIQTEDPTEIIHLITERTKHLKLNPEIKNIDLNISKELQKLLYKYPNSEPALFAKLSSKIHSGDHIFLGNSMPIRNWELTASRQIPHQIISAQRGTNGIDGQISNFLGGLDPIRHNIAILGDLTTLYGINGLWGLQFVKGFGITIIVINNSGGDIFSRVPNIKDKLNIHKNLNLAIKNPHNLNFEKLSSHWGLKYSLCTNEFPELRLNTPQLIEVIPDNLQTTNFWTQWANVR
jgi:2-succinyl-5-enolpyruvyl-6-hydroxy-3-cyclohexene-1-carboxylate synthase